MSASREPSRQPGFPTERFGSGVVSRRALLRGAGAAAGLIGLGGLLAACGSGSSPGNSGGSGGASTSTGSSNSTSTSSGGTPIVGGTFTYALNQEPESLDPEVTTYAVTNKININVFDPLIWQAPDLSYVPGLAEKWEVSPDSTKFTFNLRTDVTFHDGTKLDATAVKFSWDRIMDPNTKSKTALNQMGPFKQATVVDPATVSAEFSTPYAPFLDAVSQSYCSPVSPTAVQKYADQFTYHLVGTGPYMFKEWVKGDHITLTKYADYKWAPSIFHHQGAGYLDEIVFKIVIENATRTGVLQSGQVDGIDSVPPKDVASFKADPSKYQILLAEAPGIPTLLAINTQKFPTNDIAVRKALQYGTDKSAVIKVLDFGLYTAAYGPLTSVTLGYDSSLQSMYPYDQKKATQTLEAAGWTKGSDGYYAKNGQQLVVDYYASNTDQLPPLLQAQWKAVGINTNIKAMDYNAAIPLITKGDANLGSIGWIQADPDVCRILLYSKNISTGYGWTFFTNSTLDDDISKAASSVDATVRKPLYASIQQLTMQNALVLPLTNLFAIYGLQSHVKNFRVDTRGWYPWLYDVYLQK
ncbi:MAG TPA: ABC transporter substrate-binding protein [Thermomicrobiaceae bacterium]|nr:ABC transporter substrate-binding protein [Thermomicrobiaceae bacterium]